MELKLYWTGLLLCIRVVGALEAVNKKQGHFTFADEQVFQSLATFCGYIVQSFRTQKELHVLENKLAVSESVHG